MLFNSIEYFIFFPIFFLLYWFLNSKSLRWQNLLILIASYFFYGWWSWKFMVLLILSTLLDYIYGFMVSSSNKRKAKLFLWLSVINNLGILILFKYYNFFVTQFQQAFSTLGLYFSPILLQLVLPIGISFYTFHGMSYIFDIYRNKQKPINNIVDYAVFVSFFPLLVAGPIERANHLLPQVQKNRIFNYSQAVEGARLILWGLFKKVVIADSLAIFVDEIFLDFHDYNSIVLILGALAFSFQIYGDFSGYSDIALGSAKLLGFELLSNFKFPYFSRDIAEFWKRWHISLSSWFRDYLYIPLGGSKNGKLKTVRNTFIIFLVSGFWHGANWSFIVWGGIHAFGFLPLLLLNLNRKNIEDVTAQNSNLPNLKEIRQMFFTFSFITFAWIFFRAKDINEAFEYLKSILSNINITSDYYYYSRVFLYIIPFVIADWNFRKNERNLKYPKSILFRYLLYTTMFILILYKFILSNNATFIYFQF